MWLCMYAFEMAEKSNIFNVRMVKYTSRPYGFGRAPIYKTSMKSAPPSCRIVPRRLLMYRRTSFYACGCACAGTRTKRNYRHNRYIPMEINKQRHDDAAP